MAWKVAKAAHVGGREEQQDRVEAFVDRDGASCLLVVADGLGGHAAGARGAEAVVEAAREHWRRAERPVADPAGLLRRICMAAHDELSAVAGPGGGPRSTCALLHAGGDEAHWLSVGDSRIYHFRDGRLRARSRDQSVVQLLVDTGRLAEEEMAGHPDQSRLLESIGGERPPQPEIGSVTLAADDGFLLCTDGLWQAVRAPEMARALGARSLAQAAAALAQTAADRGGAAGDNVAVALARSGRGRRSRRLLPLALMAAALAGGLALWLLWTGGSAPTPATDGAAGSGWQDPDRTGGGKN